MPGKNLKNTGKNYEFFKNYFRLIQCLIKKKILNYNLGILAQSDILTALTLISCFQHSSSCYNTPLKITSRDFIEMNSDGVDQLNQSPKVLKLQNICPSTPTKLPHKRRFPISNEKEYDPVLSGTSSCIVKKCLDILYEGIYIYYEV